MQLTEFNYTVGQNIVLATFVGNIFKLKSTESFKLSFEKLGGRYLPELSSNKGSVWSFPSFITSQTLKEIIRNTCFECGGLMKDDEYHSDHILRKCTSCGHSHT